jgi:hypothetical protein
MTIAVGKSIYSRIIEIAIAFSAALFVLVLAIAAYFDRSIIILHVVEALPYLIAPILCLKKKKFGYFLAFASGGFWLWTAGFLTTFIRNGFEQLEMFIKTGSISRFDIFIAVPAASGTAGLVFFSLLGYINQPKKRMKDILLLLLACLLIATFFVIIFWLFAPKYLEMFQNIFR